MWTIDAGVAAVVAVFGQQIGDGAAGGGDVVGFEGAVGVFVLGVDDDEGGVGGGGGGGGDADELAEGFGHFDFDFDFGARSLMGNDVGTRRSVQGDGDIFVKVLELSLRDGYRSQKERQRDKQEMSGIKCRSAVCMGRKAICH